VHQRLSIGKPDRVSLFMIVYLEFSFIFGMSIISHAYAKRNLPEKT